MENTDCNDTPTGVCVDDKFSNIYKAIDNVHAEEHTFLDNIVGAGYYIKKPWGGSVFVPIRTGIHPFLNPIYRLRNKSIYKFLNDCNTWAFLDTTLYNFPPEAVSLVYYQDHFSIQDVHTGLFLDSNLLDFKKREEAGTVCIIPFRDTMYIDQKYIPIRKNTAISFNIPESSLILGRDGVSVKWKMNLSFSERDPIKIYKKGDTNPFFVLDNEDKLKQVKSETEGKITLDFADEFFIELDGKYIFENANNKLVLTQDTYEECKGRNVHFKFIPHVRAYYCDSAGEEGTIKNVSLEFAEIEHNGKATYKGNKLYRNPGCWGFCKGSGWNWRVVLGIFLIFFILLTYSVISYKKISPNSRR